MIGVVLINKSEYLVCATEISPIGFVQKGQNKCGIYIIDDVSFYPIQMISDKGILKQNGT